MDNSQKEIEELEGVLNNSVEALKLSQLKLSQMVTSDAMDKMTPNEKFIMEKANQLSKLDLSNPEQLMKMQKELIDLMDAQK